MPTHYTTKQLAAIAIENLESLADAVAARQSRSYFKPHENVALYGVKTPRLRELEKELYAEVRDGWSVADAVSLCDHLVQNDHLEAKALGLLLLSRFHKSFEKSLLQRTFQWLSNDRCDNWATTDVLSTQIVAPLLRKHRNLIPEVKEWTAADNLWVRRAAAVSLVPLARRGEELDSAYEVAEELLGCHEDLIHKATGWLLREAGKTNLSRLERFLVEHGPNIPRTALRYAIERFPSKKRKQILAATKLS